MKTFLDETGLGVLWTKVKQKINALINDSSASNSTVYSSSKVNSLLSGKADNEDIPTKLSQLTNDSGYLKTSNKAVANGVASLDASGRIPASQMPYSVMEYKGTWNASTNTPALSPTSGTNGDRYIVAVAGTWNGTYYRVNDGLVFNGTTHQWDHLVSGNVSTVNTKTGDVVLKADDIDLPDDQEDFEATEVMGALSELYSHIGSGGTYHEVTYADYLAHKTEYDATNNLYIIKDSGMESDAASIGFFQAGLTDVGIDVQQALSNTITKINNLHNDDYIYGLTSTRRLWTDGRLIYRAIVRFSDVSGTNKINTAFGSDYANIANLINSEIHVKLNSDIIFGTSGYVQTNVLALKNYEAATLDVVNQNGSLYLTGKIYASGLVLNEVLCIVEFTKNNQIFSELLLKSAPAKTRYVVGENFQSTGIILSAYCSDGITDITNFTVTNGTNLQASQTSVTLSVTKYGTTKTILIPIEVTE